MARVTVKDIAEKVKVSQTAVSQVLNNKPCRISEEKRKLILETARQMDYRPNRNAVALATSHTNNIGVIVYDISNSFFGDLAKAIDDVLYEAGYQIILVNMSQRATGRADLFSSLGLDSTDGLIFASDLSCVADPVKQYVEAYRKSGKPIVAIDSMEKMGLPDINYDNEEGAYLATKYLLDMGHRRIGCLTGLNFLPLARMNGYKRALEEYGVAYDEELVLSGDYHEDTGYKLSRELVDRGATAIFTFSDLMAYGVYRMAREAHLKIGEDLSVVGFDDLRFSSLLSVPLTSVRQPSADMGAAAAGMLLEMLKEKKTEGSRVRFEARLVVRDSVKDIN